LLAGIHKGETRRDELDFALPVAGSMSNQNAGGLNQGLKVGLAVSIQGSSQEEFAASVATSRPDEIWLGLSRPCSKSPFQKGDRVRIKYWNEGSIVYCWDADVIQIAGAGHQHVAIVMRGSGITIQRRRYYRVNSTIPFSFSVIDAAETHLIGERFSKAKTQNISVAGLRFETSLGLKVGDKLEMNLRLPGSQVVNAVGWVVRTEAVPKKDRVLSAVALQFLQLEEDDQIQLLEFLAQSSEETARKSAQRPGSRLPQPTISQPIGT
jgi:c-di-GMP-binding flagellar brake protein YcgR